MPALAVVWALSPLLLAKRLGTSMCSTGQYSNDGRAQPMPGDEGQARQSFPEVLRKGVGVPNLLAIGERKVTLWGTKDTFFVPRGAAVGTLEGRNVPKRHL